MSDLIKHIKDAGFSLPEETVIKVFVGGSQLHGAKVNGYDDLDIYGCYIEPASRILGLLGMEHFVWSSSSDAVKNTAADVDVTMYSLHRWGELMMKGNPAILHYMFARDSRGVWKDATWDLFIQSLRHKLLTKKSAKQYLGFANAQRMRLTGEKGMGRHGQRPDLIEKFGFDTKFAMHYVRLLLECEELLEEHTLTFPNRYRGFLIDIRQGKYTQAQVFKCGDGLRTKCEQLLGTSSLPDEVDAKELSDHIAQAYLYHWGLYKENHERTSSEAV